MKETLREITEGMEHRRSPLDGDLPCYPKCSKCLLEKLLSEAECDLVKLVRAEAKRHADFAEAHSNPAAKEVCLAIGEALTRCADRIETWLAVNLPMIKADARLEEAKWWYYENPVGNQFRMNKEADSRIADLSAQSKGAGQ